MRRGVLKTIAVVLLCFGHLTAQQQTETTREQDVYAVYSVLMTNPPTSFRSDPNELYAIASETRTIRRPRPAEATGVLTLVASMGMCIEPPPGYAARWAEVMAEVDAGTDIPVALKRELKLTKPYVLLSPEDAAKFISSILSRGSRSPVASDPKLQGAVSLFVLGNVYFDKARTLALTNLSSTCGSLCGYGTAKIFEKQADGVWREVRPARNCDVVA
jgi:hypothetical protein